MSQESVNQKSNARGKDCGGKQEATLFDNVIHSFLSICVVPRNFTAHLIVIFWD
jgi:hypothetical protein